MNILQTYSTGAYQYKTGLQMLGGANQGNVFYVRPKNGSDGQDGRSPQTAFKTLAAALSAATANQNDVVYLMAESNTAANTTDYQSTVLTWNKDGVHLIGVNDGSMMGQRARISNLSTATAIVDGLFVVQANNCYIANLEIFQGQGGTNPSGASIAMVVSGQRNVIDNCQISGIGHLELDDATSCSLAVSGSENLFTHCYIGLDTVLRTTATAEVRITDGTNNTFEDCVINSYTATTTFKSIIYTVGSAHKLSIFKNCLLVAEQNRTGTVAPTGAVLTAANTAGNIIFHGCGIYGYANYSTITDAKILLLSYAGLATHATLPGISAGQQTT